MTNLPDAAVVVEVPAERQHGARVGEQSRVVSRQRSAPDLDRVAPGQPDVAASPRDTSVPSSPTSIRPVSLSVAAQSRLGLLVFETGPRR